MRASFPDKGTFYFGTVYAETEREAEIEIIFLWNATFPFQPPEKFSLIPGSVIVNLDEYDD